MRSTQPLNREQRESRPGADLFRRIVSALAAAFLVVTGVVSMPAAAIASPNDKITLEVTGITGGSGSNGQLVVGDRIQIDGTWSAIGASPQPGDTFTLTLPDELRFPATVPLNLVDSGGAVWGKCIIEEGNPEMVCTLTDLVQERPEEVHGTFSLDVLVEEATDASHLSFDLNGETSDVELPGGGGISDGVVLPTDYAKSGKMNDNNWSMTWTIQIPGGMLEGENVVKITDVLNDTHQLCEDVNLNVFSVRDGDPIEFAGGITLNAKEDGSGFELLLDASDAPFDPERTYYITYETCTTSGGIDVDDTVYQNTADVDVEGIGGTGIIGIHPKPWHSASSKSGNVLGGEDRNGKIAWTITIPGDELLGKTEITLKDVLGEGHEVCWATGDGGEELRNNITITERYGPSSQQQKDVTSRFTAVVNSSSENAFGVTYTITDPEEFHFQPSDYRYLISYTTCVTEEGLQAGGTSFLNTAHVNEVEIESGAEVPERDAFKAGQLVGETVTIGGEDHFPQTALKWTVTIPGESILDDVKNEPLSFADMLNPGIESPDSWTHQVCSIPEDHSDGDDITDLLKPTLTAVDQVDGGGLDSVAITDKVSVTGNANKLDFVIQPPTGLPTPNGGTADGFSDEYQYVLTYYTCTTSGGMDAAGTEYTNSIPEFSSDRYNSTITQDNRSSGTGTGVSRGSVEITKVLDEDAPGADFVPENQNFRVHVAEYAPGTYPEGSPETTYLLDVPLNSDQPISGFNQRGRGWVAVITEPTFPSVSGVIFADPVFSATGADDGSVAILDGGKTAVVQLTPGNNIGVTVENTTMLGSLEIHKEDLAGDAVDRETNWPDEFDVVAKIDTSHLGSNVPAQDDVEFTLTPGGASVVIDELPIGAKVTFEEDLPEPNANYTWTATFTPDPLTVTAAHANEPAEVSLTNEVNRTRGTIQVSKEVTGDGRTQPGVPNTVEVTATWTEDADTPEAKSGSEVLNIPTNGSAVSLSTPLLIGTVVTFTETALTNSGGVEWLGTTVSVNGGTAVDGLTADANVTFGETPTVKFVNDTDISIAGLTLSKAVTDNTGLVAVGHEYHFSVMWPGLDEPRQITLQDGESVLIADDIDAFTKVTITETDPYGNPKLDWSVVFTGEGVVNKGNGVAEITVSGTHEDVMEIQAANEADWAPMSIEVSKLIADTPGAEFVDDGTEFTVNAQEINPAGEPVGEPHTLNVPLNGPAVEQVLDGLGEDWTVELSEPVFPQVPGVSFADARFLEAEGVTVSEDGKTAILTVTPGATTQVALENTVELGSLEIVKELTGGAADEVPADKTYGVTAHIDTSALGENFPAQEDRELTLTAGEPVTIADLPIGSVVTFTEVKPTDDNLLTWGEQVFDPESVEITTGHIAEPSLVTLTNTVERTVGTFSIVKNITGAEAENPAVPDTVTITATWDEEGTEGSKTLTVPTDGTPVTLGEDLLIGTKVTLTETPLEDHSGIAWAAPVWTGDNVEIDSQSAVVTVTRDGKATVSLENHAATSVAGISILKGISGAAAGEVDPETEFPVTLTWTDAEGTEQSRELDINAVDPVSLGEQLPAGTVVTITEGEQPAFDTVIWGDIVITGEGVEDAGDGSAQITVSDQQDAVTLVTVTNTADWTPATFSIEKTLADTPGAAFVANTVEFTVNVKEIDAEGTVHAEYPLTVTTAEEISRVAQGLGHGWTLELSEPVFPEVQGVSFGDPRFIESDGVAVNDNGTVATVTLTAGAHVSVSLENEAQLGSASIVKQLAGGGAAQVDPEKTYRVTAHIDTSAIGENFPAHEDRTLDLVAGEAVVLENLPIGSVVTFTEVKPVDDDMFTWGAQTFAPESVTVTTAHVTEPAAVTLTNEVERTVGTFSIVKNITGAEAENPAVPDTVTVTATWDEEGVTGGKVLDIPTDGTPVALGEDLLIGTKVTLTETPLEDHSGIAWAAPVWTGDGVSVDGTSAVVTVLNVATTPDAQVTLENHAATSVAGISILKGLAGDAASEVDPETEFPVTLTWTDAEGTEQSRELNINSVEPVALGEELPAGTVVTITEGEQPTFDTVIWGDIVITGEGVEDASDGSAQITVSDQQDAVTLVTVTNEATWAPGTFSLTKHVTGVPLSNPDVADTVTVRATWAIEGELFALDTEVPVDGTTVPVGLNLPHGTEVTLAELPLADAEAFTWADVQWDAGGVSVNEDGTATIVISAATDLQVDLTNEAITTLGSLEITKVVTGSGADAVQAGHVFPVTATWTDLQDETVKVELEVVAGETTVLEGIPFGTEVTLVEGKTDTPQGLKFLGATWSTSAESIVLDTEGAEAVITVTGDPATVAKVTLDNEYEKVPELPSTGGALPMGLVALGGLLLVGGTVLLVRNRRTA